MSVRFCDNLPADGRNEGRAHISAGRLLCGQELSGSSARWPPDNPGNTLMRLGKTSGLLISVLAYFVFLSLVVWGGMLGAHALLSASPPPGFLLADEPDRRSAPESRAPLPAVVFKLSQPVAAPSKTWTSSIRGAYAASPPVSKHVAERPSSKRKSRASRKLSHEARDAYASGRAWRSPGF